MFQIIKKNSYLFIFLAFIVDVLSEPFFNNYFLETLVSALIITSFFKLNKSLTIFALILLSIKSFAQYGIFGFNLGLSLLLIIFIQQTRTFFSNLPIMGTFYMIVFLLMQSLINSLALGYSFSFYNLVSYLFINGLITFLLIQILCPSNEKSLTT